MVNCVLKFVYGSGFEPLQRHDTLAHHTGVNDVPGTYNQFSTCVLAALYAPGLLPLQAVQVYLASQEP